MDMDVERDKGRTGRVLLYVVIVIVSFVAIIGEPHGLLKGSGDRRDIPVELSSEPVAEWKAAVNRCYANLDVSESVEKCHPYYGWYVGTMEGAFIISLLAIMVFYLRRSAAVASDRAILNLTEDAMLLLSVNLLGFSYYFRYLVLFRAMSFMEFPGHMFFLASMWGFLIVACFIACWRTRREQSDVALKWDQARGGRVVLLIVVFAVAWPAIFLSPPGFFKDTGYIRSIPTDLSSDPLAEWKVSLKECYANLDVGDLVTKCHPFYDMYGASMEGAFTASLLAIMVYHVHRFGAVAKDNTMVIFSENVVLLIGVNLLGLGLYIRQLMLFGEISFMAIPERLFFVVSIWLVLNVGPVMCLLTNWRGLRRGSTIRLPFRPTATKYQLEQLTD